MRMINFPNDDGLPDLISLMIDQHNVTCQKFCKEWWAV